MRKNRFLYTLAVPGTLALGLLFAPAAQAASCIPTPGTPGQAAVIETIFTPGIPGVDAIDQRSHIETILQRITEGTFKVGEVPPGWEITGEPHWVKTADAVDEIEEQKETQRSGWVREVPEGEGWIKYNERTIDAKYKTQYQQTRVTQEYQPAVPAQGEKQIEVENPDYIPGKPAVEEKFYLNYQYQKQVKGVTQSKNFWGQWVNTGTFGWENWSGSTQWSTKNLPVLESGPHSSVISETRDTRKVSTNYQYVPNGVIDKVITQVGSPAVDPVGTKTIWIDNPNYIPGKEAVEEERETLWFDAETVEGWTFTGETQQVETDASYTEYKYKRTVITQEHVPGIAEQGYFEVDATYTETTGWLIPEELVEYDESWVVLHTNEVIDQHAVPGVIAVPDKTETKTIRNAILGTPATVCAVEVVAAPAAAQPKAQSEELATTGSDLSALAMAGSLIAFGAAGIIGAAAVSRRRQLDQH